jgi:hypothetical protein
MLECRVSIGCQDKRPGKRTQPYRLASSVPFCCRSGTLARQKTARSGRPTFELGRYRLVLHGSGEPRYAAPACGVPLAGVRAGHHDPAEFPRPVPSVAACRYSLPNVPRGAQNLCVHLASGYITSGVAERQKVIGNDGRRIKGGLTCNYHRACNSEGWRAGRAAGPQLMRCCRTGQKSARNCSQLADDCCRAAGPQP